MSRELKRSNPDRVKLENQCISAIAFGGSEVRTPENDDEDDTTTTVTTETNSSLGPTTNNNSDDPLRAPLWILVINIVAMEMLRSKLPPGMYAVRVLARLERSSRLIRLPE